jgi:hypothetical protein
MGVVRPFRSDQTGPPLRSSSTVQTTTAGMFDPNVRGRVVAMSCDGFPFWSHDNPVVAAAALVERKLFSFLPPCSATTALWLLRTPRNLKLSDARFSWTAGTAVPAGRMDGKVAWPESDRPGLTSASRHRLRTQPAERQRQGRLSQTSAGKQPPWPPSRGVLPPKRRRLAKHGSGGLIPSRFRSHDNPVVSAKARQMRLTFAPPSPQPQDCGCSKHPEASSPVRPSCPNTII